MAIDGEKQIILRRILNRKTQSQRVAAFWLTQGWLFTVWSQFLTMIGKVSRKKSLESNFSSIYLQVRPGASTLETTRTSCVSLLRRTRRGTSRSTRRTSADPGAKMSGCSSVLCLSRRQRPHLLLPLPSPVCCPPSLSEPLWRPRLCLSWLWPLLVFSPASIWGTMIILTNTGGGRLCVFLSPHIALLS